MNKSILRILYVAFIVVIASLFSISSDFLNIAKLFVLVVLSYMLVHVTAHGRKLTIFHQFNMLFALSIIVFVIYSALFKAALYSQIRLLFFLLALIGFAMSLYYEPKRVRIVLPPRPIIRKTVASKQVVSKTKTVSVAKKKSAKKVAKKTTKKKTAIRHKTTKKTTKKKTAKKTTKRGGSKDANLISFSKDHEVAYILRKHKKRITKDNKEKLIAAGKKFKSMKSFKPHNRESFYAYMKKYKVLSKLS